jgi:hypothetical protein
MLGLIVVPVIKVALLAKVSHVSISLLGNDSFTVREIATLDVFQQLAAVDTKLHLISNPEAMEYPTLLVDLSYLHVAILFDHIIRGQFASFVMAQCILTAPLDRTCNSTVKHILRTLPSIFTARESTVHPAHSVVFWRLNGGQSCSTLS